jgi:hypothetical protein
MSTAAERALKRRLSGRSRDAQKGFLSQYLESQNSNRLNPLDEKITQSKQKIATAAGVGQNTINYDGIVYGKGSWNVPHTGGTAYIDKRTAGDKEVWILDALKKERTKQGGVQKTDIESAAKTQTKILKMAEIQQRSGQLIQDQTGGINKIMAKNFAEKNPGANRFDMAPNMGKGMMTPVNQGMA